MNPEIIDTHAHLNLSAFQDDYDEVINLCLQKKTGIINVGTNYQTSRRAVEISKKYPENIWAAVGLHPLHLEATEIDPWEVNGQKGSRVSGENFIPEQYEHLLKSSSRVVAIGEIGLDYWRLPKEQKEIGLYKERQKQVLQEQLDFAVDHHFPVIIHTRSAFPDIIKIFEKREKKLLRGVIHCFTGTWAEAKFFLDFGFYLGFDGVIFKTDVDETIVKMPISRMLVETDCPYLTPPQKKGERNTPLNLKFIIDKLARLRNITSEEVAQVTTQNARELFKLP